MGFPTKSAIIPALAAIAADNFEGRAQRSALVKDDNRPIKVEVIQLSPSSYQLNVRTSKGKDKRYRRFVLQVKEIN